MITLAKHETYTVPPPPHPLPRAHPATITPLAQSQRPNGLFYHAPDVPYYWARGDGWMAVGMADLLSYLPEDHKDRPRIMEGYLTMMESLKGYQREDGMWNPLIDEPDFWAEPPGSPLFTYAFLVGLNQGWFPPNPH